MFNLPPPPQFILPPPPPLPSDIFDFKMRPLTCSSIRSPQSQHIDVHLIFISCLTFLIVSVLLALLFIWMQSYHRRKTLMNKSNSKTMSTIQKESSIYNNCSYETIDSDNYLEAIITKDTIISINRNDIMCNQYHQTSSPSSYYAFIFY
ncbi:unnamed protein product [Rotaria magnacalcarata]|uniref:Uncharacterized protein n=1 Tax=Rotaria magnacalcarata TaxID=392030 RepID=A0A819PNP9_9BILA|nr:unnamed protein product [Rotaria magnacalcarata]CAF1680564.1 unnamed protein product [Rotaria magnacalcarata]CAF2082875.1 unnamed protein product [Rotaria magnacalcarata]CAF2144301.1 unnamed protein product [Rotaria magnacalcarata]CAF2186073.1 unnamed protein product [Rotaria magnacalcarata]